MFGREYEWARARRRAIAKACELLNIEGQLRWHVDKTGAAEGIFIPGRCVYALTMPTWNLPTLDSACKA
ncbi:hypothetical protein CBM2637_B110405 [Cupriavidus taiwanensis]|nr:hypothetical protein CBM2637_B110405 [Cupriavidus taiwanensis]